MVLVCAGGRIDLDEPARRIVRLYAVVELLADIAYDSKLVSAAVSNAAAIPKTNNAETFCFLGFIEFLLQELASEGCKPMSESLKD